MRVMEDGSGAKPKVEFNLGFITRLSAHKYTHSQQNFFNIINGIKRKKHSIYAIGECS